MKKLFRWCINFIRTLDWNEVFRYFIAGFCATVLNIFTFWLLGKQLGFNSVHKGSRQVYVIDVK